MREHRIKIDLNSICAFSLDNLLIQYHGYQNVYDVVYYILTNFDVQNSNLYISELGRDKNIHFTKLLLKYFPNMYTNQETGSNLLEIAKKYDEILVVDFLQKLFQ